MSQKTAVLRMLEEGRDVTPYSALQEAGTLRLSERIRELKADGKDIVSQRVKRGQAWVAKYSLLGAA